jgi:circadian clock protein KaiC
MNAAATGIAGLDDILGGGFPAHHVYLVEGDPGAGKTTLALQFMLEGKRRGERGLYIALSETEAELRETAAAHGWSLEGIDVFELNAAQQTALGADISLFHAGEIELGEAMKTLLEEVARRDPQRVVFDSLSEIRLLAQQPLRYRRQILALKQHFADKRCTVLLLDDRSQASDRQVTSLAHGVLNLEQLAPTYGAERRRLRISKLRGVRYRGGYHDFVIATGGLRVFPRLVAAEHRHAASHERASSGSRDLDALLGGGLMRGTSTLVLGPPGSGKSSLVAMFAAAAAARGERGSIYLFDENVETYVARADGLGLPIREHLASGLLTLQQIDPAELSPGELVHTIRGAVEGGARLVAIDSLNGYLQAMPEDRFLVIQLHELLMYLAQRDVLSFLVTPQQGLLGPAMQSTVEVSYLADTVVLMRYFEAEGSVRNAISVLKQRTSAHEKTIRELSFGPGGLRVGAPLSGLRGVLTGVPSFSGRSMDLLAGRGSESAGDDSE